MFDRSIPVQVCILDLPNSTSVITSPPVLSCPVIIQCSFDIIAGPRPIHLCVRRPLNLAHDIIPLGEERIPLAQHCLCLIRQIVPVWSAVFGLQGRLRQCARGVFAGENYGRSSISLAPWGCVWRLRVRGRGECHTVVLSFWSVCVILAHVEDCAFYGDQGRFVGGVA